MSSKRMYGYYKTKQGSEIFLIDKIEIEQPFFSFISNFLNSDDSNLLDPFHQLFSNENCGKQVDYKKELSKINSPHYSLPQRLFAQDYLNKIVENEQEGLKELRDIDQTIKNLKGALADLIDYTLDESNSSTSGLNSEERLQLCLEKSLYKEIIEEQLSKGVIYSYSSAKTGLFEKVTAEDPISLIQSIVQYYLRKDIKVKQCKNCGRFFIPSRLSQDYCEYVAPNQIKKTCRDIGATKSFAEKKSDDEVYQLYSKYYKRIYRYVSTGKLSKEDFQNWNTKALEKRDATQNDELNFSRYASDLEQLFSNVLSCIK